VPLHAPLDAKIRYLRSAVPLGHMTMEEYELGLETIRWVEQDQLRTQTRRSRRSRSHDLNLWRGAYDVLHRLECEQDARREKNRALQRRRWKTLPSFPELNTTPYNRLLRYLARIPNLEPDKKVQVAEDFLQRMTDLSSLVSARSFDGLGGSVVPCPDRHTYHAFFYVCVATSREHPANSQIALQKAQALLQRLESESGATNCWSIEDGENDNDSEMAQKSGYDAIIQIHSNQASDVYGAAAAAEDALLRLSHRSTSRPRLQPTAETFNRVLKAWSACRETKGADRAHEILKLQLSLGPPASPDQVSFGTVMAAYGKRRRPEEAQTIWEECVRFLGRAGSANAADRDRIDLTGCFEVLVSAWARSMLPEAVIRIKDLIRTVVHGSHDSFVVRDTAVIHSRLVQTMVAKRKVVAAHEHLLEMVERSRQGSGPVPMARAFNCVFVGWKNAVLAEPWQALLAAQRSMELLRVMMSAGGECSTDPNTFYLITDVLCHALEASTDLQVERSEEVSSIVQDGFLEILGHAEQRKQVRGVMYHRIIHSLCRHATPETSTMASLVLNQYYEQARRQWDVEWIPNQTVGLYTTVFAALARIKSVEATERALELFRVMSALKGDSGRDLALVPTVRTYTSALQAVSWLRNNRSAQVASEMFEKLKLLDADPNYHVKFDGIVFAVLLEASVADSDLCCRIFSEIVQLRRSGRTNLDEIARYQATVVQALVHGGQSERDALEKVATICASM
jgi:transposase InsO family protein